MSEVQFNINGVGQVDITDIAADIRNLDIKTEEGRTEFKAVLENHSLRELASMIVEWTTAYDAMKKKASRINEELEQIKMYTAERMDQEGVQNSTFPGIGRLGISPIVRASVRAGSKDQAYEWLETHGHGDLITTTVNASSLAALIRREIKEGNEVPEEIFNVHQYDLATVTKS